jgi:hypothetical protein
MMQPCKCLIMSTNTPRRSQCDIPCAPISKMSNLPYEQNICSPWKLSFRQGNQETTRETEGSMQNRRESNTSVVTVLHNTRVSLHEESKTKSVQRGNSSLFTCSQCICQWHYNMCSSQRFCARRGEVLTCGPHKVYLRSEI